MIQYIRKCTVSNILEVDVEHTEIEICALTQLKLVYLTLVGRKTSFDQHSIVIHPHWVVDNVRTYPGLSNTWFIQHLVYPTPVDMTHSKEQTHIFDTVHTYIHSNPINCTKYAVRQTGYLTHFTE